MKKLTAQIESVQLQLGPSTIESTLRVEDVQVITNFQSKEHRETGLRVI